MRNYFRCSIENRYIPGIELVGSKVRQRQIERCIKKRGKTRPLLDSLHAFPYLRSPQWPLSHDNFSGIIIRPKTHPSKCEHGTWQFRTHSPQALWSALGHQARDWGTSTSLTQDFCGKTMKAVMMQPIKTKSRILQSLSWLPTAGQRA